MQLSWIEISSRALKFSKKWKDAKDEAAEAQSFLNDFFEIFGVDRKRIGTFETKVPMGKTRNGYIDLLWKGVILIEMKSFGKSLDKAYSQARDYAFHLEEEELPEYIMVSDFHRIRLYRSTTGQIWNIKTAQLHKHVKLFSDLAGYKATIEKPTDKEVDIKAAEKMAKLHDILKNHGYEGHQLEVYLVRLLFCMFADDTGIFEKNIFFDYISNSKVDGSDLSARIARLFEILDTPPLARAKQTMLSEELKRFAYINGKLFSERLSFADYDYKMRKIVLECCALDWGYISPAIFGAMFQGVMNPQQRRELGAHYTSEENILKVIKPLFLDELREEFERIKSNSKQLQQFHERLSKLKFLDPACGCGNFLIITYRELRRLELEVLKMLIDNSGQLVMDISPYCIVNVNQFYGIEIEEFPSQIAQTGMWLIDHQMNTIVAEHFGLYYARLPLEQSATIINDNALTVDWECIVPKKELSYILGNPPFIGYSFQNSEQKADILNTFVDYEGKTIKNAGKIDYVAAWYFKAANYIQGTDIDVAFVSTNSIVQGEQVSKVWKPIMQMFNININFAYRPFIWSNEAKGKAAVHCVIVGFSLKKKPTKFIFEQGNKLSCDNINPYLVNAPTVFIESTKKPVSDVPEMVTGNRPADGGHLIIEDDDMEMFIQNDPLSAKYIRRFMGATEYINNTRRWCLWLVGVSPAELHKMPEVMKRVRACKDDREKSSDAGRRKLADTPMLFREQLAFTDDYMIVPCVSSERRKYIPVGFVDKNVIVSNLVLTMPNATIYHFGILISNIHMAWMRAVAGRLKSDYRYSKDIVYNNFPWPEPTGKQREEIEVAAQAILDARALFPDSSLAQLYDPLTIPPELVKAHNRLDKAVAAAYGDKGSKTEAEIVADLMERYQQLINS
ncbi:MAG: N-6 DNA methylase [Syntrophomonadaceae bacterium]|jgi:hypothetical protein|nr:N-6 DNA methylase [Syntrophomonadaceae bacterium]